MLVDIEPLLAKCKEIYNSRMPFAASLIIREMEKAKVVDVVEVKHARWIVSEFCGGNRIGFCTECEVENRIGNYCPNCGAKMDGNK